MIVSGSRDKTVRIWDAATGQPIGNPLTGHTDNVTSLTIGRLGDQDVIISGSEDKTTRIWDTGGQVAAVIDLLEPVRAIALSPDGALFVASGQAVCAFATKRPLQHELEESLQVVARLEHGEDHSDTSQQEPET